MVIIFKHSVIKLSVTVVDIDTFCLLQMGSHPVAVVRYSTHLHTSNIQNRTNINIRIHKHNTKNT